MSHPAEFNQCVFNPPHNGKGIEDGSTVLAIRIKINAEQALGPGKIRLMELIMENGSISAASRAMGMSYRRAWMLADDLNSSFREPVILKKVGGSHGGGAEVTELGRDVVARYRRIEQLSHEAAAADLAVLRAAFRTDSPGKNRKA